MQNYLILYSIAMIQVPVFQILMQTKLLITALLSFVISRRTYVRNQWYALMGLSTAFVCVLSSADGNYAETSEHTFSAMVLLVLANLCSAAASICFEMFIDDQERDNTKSPSVSIWTRNVQMSYSCVSVLGIKIMFFSKNEENLGFLNDFSLLVWVMILLFSLGSLIVSFVFKYTDNVTKGIAMSITVILSTVLSALFEDENYIITPSILSSGALAMLCCYIFGNPTAFQGNPTAFQKRAGGGIAKI